MAAVMPKTAACGFRGKMRRIMRMYLMSDNVDTLTGMRLAGVAGEVVHTREAFQACLERVLEKEDICIILITEKAAELAPDLVEHTMMNRKLPLVSIIPDRHGRRSDK